MTLQHVKNNAKISKRNDNGPENSDLRGGLHINSEDNFYSQRSKLYGRESINTNRRLQGICNQNLEPKRLSPAKRSVKASERRCHFI